jgi:hypothetical protein
VGPLPWRQIRVIAAAIVIVSIVVVVFCSRTDPPRAAPVVAAGGGDAGVQAADVPVAGRVADNTRTAAPSRALFGGVLRDRPSGHELAGLEYWFVRGAAAFEVSASRPPPAQFVVRRSDDEGRWDSGDLQFVGDEAVFLVVRVGLATTVLQELPRDPGDIEVCLPVATVTLRCFGLPATEHFRVHVYPLDDVRGGSPQLLERSTTAAVTPGRPPLIVRSAHAAMAADVGAQTLSFPALAGTAWEVAVDAGERVLDQPVHRIVAPADVVVRVVHGSPGFRLQMPGSAVRDARTGLGAIATTYVLEDGTHSLRGVVEHGSAWLDSAVMADRARLVVRRDDGAVASLDVRTREAEAQGVLMVPEEQFVPALVLESETQLVGVLSCDANGRTRPVRLHGPLRRADEAVLGRGRDGRQFLSEGTAAVAVRRVGVAADGRGGEVLADGRVVWAQVQPLRCSPRELWSLPSGVRRVHVVVEAAVPGQESAAWIEVVSGAYAPTDEFLLQLSPSVLVYRVHGAAESGADAGGGTQPIGRPAGVTPLPTLRLP